MAKVKIQGNASGTGVVTLTAPNTDTDRTITLPDEDITLGGGGDLSFGGDTFGADKTIGSNDNYALSFETNATERLKLTNDGRGLSQFTAKAWCFIEWNNTIYDSHNISSITELGTGHSKPNFTNTMGNANYAVATSSEGSSVASPSARTTSNVSIRLYQPTTGNWADAQLSIVVFGD